MLFFVVFASALLFKPLTISKNDCLFQPPDIQTAGKASLLRAKITGGFEPPAAKHDKQRQQTNAFGSFGLVLRQKLENFEQPPHLGVLD